MIYSAIIYLSRAVCLMLALATGMSGIAFASHDGSHGSHCIDPAMLAQLEVGKEIEFIADRVNGKLTVTELQ